MIKTYPNTSQRRLIRSLVAFIFAFSVTLGASGATPLRPAQKITPIINFLLFSDSKGGEKITMEEASRFLIQTTFGPTYEDIVRLSNSSYENWISTQMNMPVTHTVAYTESQNWVSNYPLIVAGAADSALINVMLTAPDQLRQRVAYALSQIFVVSREVSNGVDERPILYLDYYDLLADNAFANYRDLLEKVTLNSVMGFYLTMKLNAPAGTQVGPPLHPASFFVASPDENYAREVMQLFSVGLLRLNNDGTPVLVNGETMPSYTQETVENLARVFTGWNFQSANPNANAFFNLGVPQDPRPMRSWDEFHDKGPKVLLRGERLPANQTAVKDLDDALDNIFNDPNVGPFIGKLLIQHLVTSNPTPAYVGRVANVFNGNNTDGSPSPRVRGDLGAVIKTILLDPEARNGHKTLPEQFGKFKEPYIRQLSMWRGLYARRKTTNSNLFGPYYDVFARRLKQKPLRARSVFNFYQPDFSPPGILTQRGLLAPEAQLIDFESSIGIASTTEEYIQRHHDDANNDFARSATDMLINTAQYQQLVPQNLRNPEALIERLNLVFMGGAMSDEMKQILLDVHDPDVYLVKDKWEVVIDLANVILLSPQYWVQK